MSSTTCCHSSFTAVSCIILPALPPAPSSSTTAVSDYHPRMNFHDALPSLSSAQKANISLHVHLLKCYSSLKTEWNVPFSHLFQAKFVIPSSVGLQHSVFICIIAMGIFILDFMEEFWFPIIYPVVRQFFTRFGSECMLLMIMEFILCLICLKYIQTWFSTSLVLSFWKKAVYKWIIFDKPNTLLFPPHLPNVISWMISKDQISVFHIVSISVCLSLPYFLPSLIVLDRP